MVSIYQVTDENRSLKGFLQGTLDTPKMIVLSHVVHFVKLYNHATFQQGTLAKLLSCERGVKSQLSIALITLPNTLLTMTGNPCHYNHTLNFQISLAVYKNITELQ